MPAAKALGMLSKRLLLGSLLLLLVLPAVQAYWLLVPVKPLGGVTINAKAPALSWAAVQDGQFQPALEAYLTDNLGFRPWMVRLRNQLAFSLLHKSLTEGVVLGKDDNLYQQNSINAYLGRSYLGEAEIAKRARHLRRVQDSLRAHGTQLLFVLAPSKARILPQYLPDSCAAQPHRVSNYDMVRAQFAKYGVNTLDAAALMLRWQAAQPPYPLFTRTGTHWSGYAVAQLADTLFHRTEQLTGYDLPDFAQQGPPTVVNRVDELRYTDDDLGNLLNLLWDIRPYPTAYPNVVFGPSQGKQRLNTLIIGDSFAESFTESFAEKKYGFYPYFSRLFTPASRLWYYNRTIYWPLIKLPAGESQDVKKLNLAEQLRGRQLVLLLAMEGNLDDVGFGFISEAFDAVCPLTSQDETHLQAIINDIKHNPEWLANVAKGAENHQIPLEQALRENAKFVYDQSR
ncbi:MAG: alginate O-acetyltransferase AlgX-related protein [Janthinobacterium lividum]